VTTAPFRYVSASFGLVSLGSLLFSGPLAASDLGAGGVERWVVYPVVLWVVAFGGYLLGAGPAAQTRLAGRAGNESDATASARLMTTVKSAPPPAPPPTSIGLATFGIEIASHRGNWGSAGSSRPSPAFTLRLGRSRRRPRRVAARGSRAPSS
jgi:hypothetical protein